MGSHICDWLTNAWVPRIDPVVSQHKCFNHIGTGSLHALAAHTPASAVSYLNGLGPFWLKMKWHCWPWPDMVHYAWVASMKIPTHLPGYAVVSMSGLQAECSLGSASSALLVMASSGTGRCIFPLLGDSL